jgi:hypothetical protein
MKKRMGIWILAIALFPLAANAQGQRLNLVGSLGMATSNIQGLIVGLGIEMELFQNFYGQLGFDNFFDGAYTMVYSQGGQVSFPQSMRIRVFGVNLSGIYKLPLTGRVAWFTKARISYSHRSNYNANNYYYDNFDSYGYGGYYGYDPGSYYYTEDETSMHTGLAYALGTGIEYQINEKLAFIAGVIYESLFQWNTSSGGSGNRGDWAKINVGINYHLK